MKKNNLIDCLSVANAEHYSWGDNCDGWWLKKEGKFTVISELMPKGTSEQRHYHKVTEQFFYCLLGELTIELNNTIHTLLPNDSLIIPAAMKHKVINHSESEVRFLVVSCPNSHGDRVNILD